MIPPPFPHTSFVRVRPATAADADTIVALVHELNSHQGDPTGRFDRGAFVAHGCGEDAMFAPLLAEHDGTALGYVFCQPAYDSGFALRGLYVADLFVRPSARRQGVGRALLAAAARLARVSGGGYLWLTTLPWNTDAQAFYRGLATVEQPVIAFAIAGPDLDRLAASATRAR